MPGMVKMARIILMVMGILSLIGGGAFLIMFLLFSVLGLAEGSSEGAVVSIVFGGLGVGFALIFAVAGIVHLYAAKGIAEKKQWGKILGIVLGILNIPNMGIGTILGILILVGLFSSEANQWFEGGEAKAAPAEEPAAEEKQEEPAAEEEK
ncbi:hypothetical protein ACFL2D_01275 [Patescibacteria group bacterium]